MYIVKHRVVNQETDRVANVFLITSITIDWVNRKTIATIQGYDQLEDIYNGYYPNIVRGIEIGYTPTQEEDPCLFVFKCITMGNKNIYSPLYGKTLTKISNFNNKVYLTDYATKEMYKPTNEDKNIGLETTTNGLIPVSPSVDLSKVKIPTVHVSTVKQQ